MTTLSEARSKELLAPFGVPFLPEWSVDSPAGVGAAIGGSRGPFVAKLCGDAIAHKTERGLVRLGLAGVAEVEEAVAELLAAGRPEDAVTGVLVAPMVGGSREFLVGTSIDPSFGPTITFGLGGVLAEVLADVSVRLVPISRFDAEEMLGSLRVASLLDPFRGEPAVDRVAMVELLLAVSNAASSIEGLEAIDLNPVRIVDGRPVALDALVELTEVVR